VGEEYRDNCYPLPGAVSRWIINFFKFFSDFRYERGFIFWYNSIMSGNQESLDKIEKLINSAAKFNEMSFRMVLEGLVNKGGEEAEYLMVRYINAQDLDLTTRINVIRVVGYLQGAHFLIPLKKLIDSDENIQLKKEAVISVSKYNDRRALNILNRALANIKNPLLLETINAEIAKIKKNNRSFHAIIPKRRSTNRSLILPG